MPDLLIQYSDFHHLSQPKPLKIDAGMGVGNLAGLCVWERDLCVIAKLCWPINHLAQYVFNLLIFSCG